MNNKRYENDMTFVLEKIIRLENQVKEIVRILDEIDLRIKDIDMDLNDIFDDVEGKNGNNNK